MQACQTPVIKYLYCHKTGCGLISPTPGVPFKKYDCWVSQAICTLWLSLQVNLLISKGKEDPLVIPHTPNPMTGFLVLLSQTNNRYADDNEDAMKWCFQEDSSPKQLGKIDTSIINDSANAYAMQIEKEYGRFMKCMPSKENESKNNSYTFIAILVMLLCLAVIIATVWTGKLSGFSFIARHRNVIVSIELTVFVMTLWK